MTKLLTEGEAARVLKISPKTLARLRKDPRISPPVPFCNVGVIRYALEDLLQWAKSQRQGVRRGRPRVEGVESATFVRV